MPWRIYKVKGGFRVRNTDTGQVHAYRTTKKNAERQVRLLRGVEHGLVPRKKAKR